MIMKRFKKPKQEKAVYTKKEIRDLCDQFVAKSCILMMTAVADELDLDEEKICDIAKRTERYAKYEKDHIVRINEVSDMLKKKTGIDWRW